MRDALATEWLKLRTVGTSLIFLLVLAITTVLCLGYTWYVVRLWEGLDDGGSMAATPPESLAGMILPLVAGVFGVIVATAEYATGTIRPTLTALPHRVRVLLAKAVMVGVWTVVGSAACFLTVLFLAHPIVGDRPIRYLGAPLDEMLPYLLMQSVAAGVIALVGLGLGFLIRATAAAVVTMVVLVFLGQMVVGNLPSPWNDRLSSMLLAELGNQVVPNPGGVQSLATGLLSAPAAGGVMLAHVAVALALGGCRLLRDV